MATLLPLPVVLLDPKLSTAQTVLAIALPGAVHTAVGNVIEPKLFGDRLELHPVTVLMALAFWYALWGVPGAILSVPVTAAIRIVLSHLEHPYARIILAVLEGRLGDTSHHLHAASDDEGEEDGQDRDIGSDGGGVWAAGLGGGGGGEEWANGDAGVVSSQYSGGAAADA